METPIFRDYFQSTMKTPLPMVAKCGACGLYKTCKSKKMSWSGSGRKGILIVGEAPGREEDNKGIQFVGSTGQLLKRALHKAGVNMRKDCWLTNALICRPPGNEIKNEKMIEWCRPNLTNTIKELNPRLILLVGHTAVKSLIGSIWKEDVGTARRWIGWKIPSQRLNAWICPVYHPSYVQREMQNNNKVLESSFYKSIKEAVSMEGRPWEKVPDYPSQVERIYDSKKAAMLVRMMTYDRQLDDVNAPSVIAFDYETNMLKPDSDKARIVSCSLSDGDTTIAFPWEGKVVEQMKKFLIGPIPKIAANLKFEARWTKAILGIEVNNWFADTMLLAHILDNRPDICGLKFQSFVKLGQESYDDHIRPYLKADNPNEENRIKEVPLDQLLLYCGLDSLLEWKLCQIQRKELGYE